MCWKWNRTEHIYMRFSFHTSTNLCLVSNLWFVYAPFLCNFPFGLQGFRRKSHLHWRDHMVYIKKFVNSSKHVLVQLDELNWKHTQRLVIVNLWWRWIYLKPSNAFIRKHMNHVCGENMIRPAAAWQKQPTAEIPVKGQKHSRNTVKTLFLNQHKVQAVD